MRQAWIAGAACLALAAAMPAAANDSTAETKAGGLVLTRSADIDMVSEDLFVSADEVRVRYVFRNRSPREVRTTIAFPMPDRELGEEQYRDVAFPADFATTVDGQKVRMRVERKAMRAGRDHSALLASLHIPVSDEPGAGSGSLARRLEALPAAEQARLVRMGLAAFDEYDNGSGMRRHIFPAWTVRESWYWDQAFPVGRDLVVEHRYRPGTGGSVGTALTIPGFRQSPEGRRMIADYCIDSAFLAGLDRMARQMGGESPLIGEKRIGYVLTTGANWRTPIGDFRLVVDKGDAGNLISFCGTNVRKIGATSFEMRRSNWRPDRDLKLLILFPQRPGE